MKPTTTVIGLLLLFITLSSSGCMYLNGVDGNGNVKMETRDVSAFDEIRVGGAFNVILTQGDSETLKIEADENLLPLIETKVKGNTLVISTRENIRDSKKLNLYITFKDIELLDVSGACEVTNEGVLNFSNIRLEGSGASEISLQMNADKLRCHYSGASEIELAGKAKECIAELSGASEFKAYDFVVEDLEMNISGAGEAKVNATVSLKVEVSGAGSVRYMGNPSIDQRVSGAGSVSKR